MSNNETATRRAMEYTVPLNRNNPSPETALKFVTVITEYCARLLTDKQKNLNALLKNLSANLPRCVNAEFAVSEEARTLTRVTVEFSDEHLNFGVQIGNQPQAVWVRIAIVEFTPYVVTDWNLPVLQEVLFDNMNSFIADVLKHTGSDALGVTQVLITMRSAIAKGNDEFKLLTNQCEGEELQNLWNLWIVDATSRVHYLGTFDVIRFTNTTALDYAELKGAVKQLNDLYVRKTDDGLALNQWQQDCQKLIEQTEFYPEQRNLATLISERIAAVWNAMGDAYHLPPNYHLASSTVRYSLSDLAEWLRNSMHEIVGVVEFDWTFEVNYTNTCVELTVIDSAYHQPEILVFDEGNVVPFLAMGLDWSPNAPTFWIPEFRQWEQLAKQPTPAVN